MKMIQQLIAFLIFISMVVGIILPDSALASPNHTRKILILNSYHAGYPGSDGIVRGFREELSRHVSNLEITTEYLDSKNNSGPEYDRLLLELLRRKYHGKSFDLIFSSDDYAFNILYSGPGFLGQRNELNFLFKETVNGKECPSRCSGRRA